MLWWCRKCEKYEKKVDGMIECVAWQEGKAGRDKRVCGRINGGKCVCVGQEVCGGCK